MGNRPGFAWGAPRMLMPNKDIFQPLLALWQDLNNNIDEVMDFLVPAVSLPKQQGLHENTPYYPRKMSSGQFNAVLKALGRLVDPESSLTSYSLRKFLPTVADTLVFPAEWKQAIGEWVEAPARGTGSAPPAVTMMSHRYASDKTTTASEIKLACFVAIDAASSTVSKPTWDTLRQEAGQVSSLTTLAAGPRWGSHEREEVDEDLLRTPSPVKDADEQSGSDEESPSASADSDSSKASSGQACQTALGTLSWFCQDPHARAAKIHFVEWITDQGREVAFCRRGPYNTVPALFGTGVPQLASVPCKVCKRCRKKLTPEQQEELARNISDSE